MFRYCLLIVLTSAVFSQVSESASGEVPASCKGLSQEAYANMKKYKDKCSAKAPKSDAGSAITDFSQNPPKFYLLSADLSSCSVATDAAYGSGSKGGKKPKASNEDGSHGTPAGFHVTATHDGARYNSSNSIGLSGTGSENSRSRERAILIHAKDPKKSTWGCIGIPPAKFKKVQNALKNGSVVYNYFPDVKGTSANNCGPAGGGRGGKKGGRN